jgi:aminopeptidase N
LDFAQPADHLVSITRKGIPVPFTLADGHVVVDASQVRAGENELELEFIAGDDPLNRNEEFLYSLFVPARAHLAFPCFDQPDLKARYSLTLELPATWVTTANAAEVSRQEHDGRATVTFAETRPLPTYLFAFTAGKFTVDSEVRNGRVVRMFHRETDAAKVSENREALFALHATALGWLEEYTNIPYPFDKLDFVLIPSFQFSGMEHAGAILYNAASMMLEPTATQSQRLERANTISHETAHMWFGDLVTMRWFDDVWMKEVFANFMAGKIVNPSYPDVNHDLRFLLANYPAAYEVDRTRGANPIRQPLDNLTDAGALYGAIIYQKAPTVLRQLEMILGPREFRAGVREYLTRFAYGNATWPDLIRILDVRTPEDLAAWSHAWVEERGRPSLAVTRHVSADGALHRLEIVQRDPLEHHRLWPQRMVVFVSDGPRTARIPIFVHGRTTSVTVPAGFTRDAGVLLNGDGLAYGDVELDLTTRRLLLTRIEHLPDALTRGAAWVTLWDECLDGRVSPAALIETALRALPAEPDEQVVNRLLAYLTHAFWKFLSPHLRLEKAAGLEAVLRGGLAGAQTATLRAAWFAALRDVTLTDSGVRWLEQVWRHEETIADLPPTETDDITLAMELAVRDTANAQTIIQQQLSRIQNPDRRARFMFVMPALSPNTSDREQLFARFADAANRRHEPWVLEAQHYLNHPLREAHAVQFVAPSLDLLSEIQRTGDIFFPKRWIDATLAGHQSVEAAAVVEQFLARETTLPQRLQWVVLASADELVRAGRQSETTVSPSSVHQPRSR